MPHPLRSLPLLLLAAAALAADPTVRDIPYADGEVRLTGYLARPAGAEGGPRPGVLVVHEWWGLNDYAKRRARELAQAGYVAFALDMYGSAPTGDFGEAAALATPFYQDRQLMRRRAKAGLEQLRAQDGVDGARVAALGFCFGGTVVLEMARAGEDLRGAVSFHGGLKAEDRAKEGAIRGTVLVLHGGSDPLVKPDELAGFMEEMIAAKASWRVEVYGQALHAFTNPAARWPDKGIAYDAEAERRAFAATQALFREVLR